MISRIVFIFILSFLIHNSSSGQEEKYIGLFVYNFTKYFDWPETSKSGSFIIEVIGHQSVYDELVKITQGKAVGNQDIIVKYLKSVQEVGANSHIVFLGHWQSRFIGELLGEVKQHPKLIISEMEGMLEKGSDINFVIREGTIKFEMKTSNVLSRQIKIDPRIRELAYRVID